MEPQVIHFDDVRRFEPADGVSGRPLFGQLGMLHLIELDPAAAEV